MKNKNSSNFLIGLIFSLLVGAVIWYWQKSTSAEDGALALLDRLASVESKLRELREDLRNRRSEDSRIEVPEVTAAIKVENPVVPDELQQVRGVGPVFESRLIREGIFLIYQLAKLDATQLAQILDVNENRAENILAEARQMLGE